MADTADANGNTFRWHESCKILNHSKSCDSLALFDCCIFLYFHSFLVNKFNISKGAILGKASGWTIVKLLFVQLTKKIVVRYYIPDLIAIPDLGGAMENWGIITFRESAMLFDPITGSAADQKLVAMIVNHEVAHQVEFINCIPGSKKKSLKSQTFFPSLLINTLKRLNLFYLKKKCPYDCCLNDTLSHPHYKLLEKICSILHLRV